MSIVILVLMTLMVITAYLMVRKAIEIAKERGYQVPDFLALVAAALTPLLSGVPTFAQVSIDIDLTPFWDGFNQFVSTLAPPFLFISSIGAALGFIFLIGRILENLFNRNLGR